MSRHQKKSGTKMGKAASKADSLKSGAPSTHEITTLVALFNVGRYAEGEQLARALTVRFPQHGFGWKVLGALLQTQGRVEEAVAPMQKAAKLSPGDAESHNNLGSTLLAQNRLTEAEACYRQALAIQPNYVRAKFSGGVEALLNDA